MGLKNNRIIPAFPNNYRTYGIPAYYPQAIFRCGYYTTNIFTAYLLNDIY